MKLFSKSFGRLLENLRSVEGCGRNSIMGRSSKFYRSLCQDALKVYIVSKVLLVVKPKLVVVPKKKGVSKLKIRPLEKVIFGSAGTLTALTAYNDEILVESTAIFGKSSAVWTRSTAARSDLVSLMHSYGRFGCWIL